MDNSRSLTNTLLTIIVIILLSPLLLAQWNDMWVTLSAFFSK